MSTNPTPALSMEEGLNTLLCNAQHNLRQGFQNCEQRIRKAPTTAVLGALAAGYCLHRLPVRALVVAQVRLLSALAPPALLLFGAAKVVEFLQRQQTTRTNGAGLPALSNPPHGEVGLHPIAASASSQ